MTLRRLLHDRNLLNRSQTEVLCHPNCDNPTSLLIYSKSFEGELRPIIVTMGLVKYLTNSRYM